MEKINFQDGQLKKAGYVEIDATKHFITEAEYDGATPLSSFILNKLQDNIETAIGEVSSFDPVIVTELPSTNVQQKTMYLVLSDGEGTIEKYDAYIYKDNEWKQIGSAEIDPSKLTVNLVENSYKLTLTQAVAGGGTITVPSNYKVGLDRLDVYLNGEKLIKAVDNDNQGHYYEVGTQGNLSNEITITSDWSAKVGDVFEFTIRTNGHGTEVESDTVIVSGTEPTGENRQKIWLQNVDNNEKIYILNDNNVYEEFMKKEEKKILYHSQNGSNGTITLSESVANFNYIEIFYREQSSPAEYSSVKIDNPNGKRANLAILCTNVTTDKIWAKIKTVLINETSINNVLYADGEIRESTVTNNNFIYITKVLGYKD